MVELQCRQKHNIAYKQTSPIIKPTSNSQLESILAVSSNEVHFLNILFKIELIPVCNMRASSLLQSHEHLPVFPICMQQSFTEKRQDIL